MLLYSCVEIDTKDFFVGVLGGKLESLSFLFCFCFFSVISLNGRCYSVVKHAVKIKS